MRPTGQTGDLRSAAGYGRLDDLLLAARQVAVML
jgi:hypothetical protein